MREIDKKLAEALRLDDQTLLESDPRNESIFDEMLDSFRGRRRWLVALVWFWGFVFAALMITGLVMFFRVESEGDKLMWGFACLFGALANGLLKTWYWMEMNRNTMLRELKRVELQIARLAEHLPASEQRAPE